MVDKWLTFFRSRFWTFIFYDHRLGVSKSKFESGLCETFGVEAVVSGTVFDWYKRFAEVCYDVEDKSPSGRPQSPTTTPEGKLRLRTAAWQTPNSSAVARTVRRRFIVSIWSRVSLSTLKIEPVRPVFDVESQFIKALVPHIDDGVADAL